MKREDLFEAIGHVDDDLLDENVEQAEPVIWRYVGALSAAAACLAVVLGIGAWAHSHQQLPVQQLPESTTTVTETTPLPETDVPTEEIPVVDGNLTSTQEPVQTSVTLLTTTTETTLTETQTTPTEPVTEETTELIETAPDTWQSAYRQIVEKRTSPDGYIPSDRLSYGLLDVDGDDVPELVISGDSIVYLMTYQNGQVNMLMDGWGFGAMGNAGYEYLPGKNELYNHNSDYAGLISYNSYFRINAAHDDFDYYNTLKVCLFADINGNGEIDDDSEAVYDENAATYYLNDKPITAEEAEALMRSADDYQTVLGTKTCDEMLAELAE